MWVIVVHIWVAIARSVTPFENVQFQIQFSNCGSLSSHSQVHDSFKEAHPNLKHIPKMYITFKTNSHINYCKV